MKFDLSLSDQACLEELGARIARYRLNRDQTQQELAEESGVSLRTLVRIEQGESSQTVNILRVLRALDLLGNLEALVPAPGPSPMQQLKLQGRLRQRASGKSAAAGVPSSADSSSDPAPWVWGDEEDT